MKDSREWPESFFERRRQTDQQDTRGFYRLTGRSERALSFFDDHWWIPQVVFGMSVCLGLGLRLAGSFSISGWCLSGNFLHAVLMGLLVVGILGLGSWPLWTAHLVLRGHRSEAIGSCALLVPVLIVGLLGTYFSQRLPAPGPAVAEAVARSEGTRYLLEQRSDARGMEYRIYACPADGWGGLWQKRFDASTGLQPSPWQRSGKDAELLLSGDESLLVVRRNGHHTDAIDLTSGEDLTENIDPEDPIRSRLLKRRDATIEQLLADRAASGKAGNRPPAE